MGRQLDVTAVVHSIGRAGPVTTTICAYFPLVAAHFCHDSIARAGLAAYHSDMADAPLPSTIAGARHAAPAVAGLNGSTAAAPVGEDVIDPKRRKSIQSVETGVRVMEALIQARGSLPLREIAALSGMSRSQSHRYLLSYVNTGLVRQDPLSGFYSLGPMALRIGMAALSRLDHVQEASQRLRTLVDEFSYTGLLTIWGDFGPTVVRWIDGEQAIVTSLNIGSVLPLLTSSAGMVFLAFQAPSKSRRLLEAERARRDDISEAELEKRIALVRAAGYATTDGSVIPGLAAITAPVFDLQGWPAAALGIISRSSDTGFLTQRNIDAVCAAASEISQSLGWDSSAGPAVHSYVAAKTKARGRRPCAIR